MSYSGGIIGRPVTMTDISRAVGLGAIAIPGFIDDYLVLSYLILNGYYNRWAKFKPVRLGVPFPDSPDWWRADNGLCGIAVPAFDNIASACADETPYALDRADMPWYRMPDFDGYNENSIRPFVLRVPQKVVISATGSHTYVRLSLLSVRTDNLAFWELFKDGYLGVIMHRTGATGINDYRAIANVRITSAMASTVDIQIDDCGGDVLMGSAVDIAVIVATELTETWSSALNGTIYTLNDTVGFSVKKNAPVYQERDSTYSVAVLLGGVVPRRYFTVGGVEAGGGMLTAVATWITTPAALDKTYDLLSITVRATDLYDGSLLAEETFDYRQQTDLPPYIDDAMRVDRVPFTLRTELKQLRDADGRLITNAAFSYRFDFV